VIVHDKQEKNSLFQFETSGVSEKIPNARKPQQKLPLSPNLPPQEGKTQTSLPPTP
jgi:hypothetical protein